MRRGSCNRNRPHLRAGVESGNGRATDNNQVTEVRENGIMIITICMGEKQ